MVSVYDIDIFHPIKNKLKLFERRFVLSPELWGKFRIDDIGIDFSQWDCVKLMKDGRFSEELSRIPNQFGGIYIYCIEPRIVPNVGNYVMYVGKATKTESENLRIRVKSYSKFLYDEETRPTLYNLFSQWGDYVYVHYLPINGSGDAITAVEDRLIAVFGKPPCNAQVRCTSVKIERRAFDD